MSLDNVYHIHESHFPGVPNAAYRITGMILVDNFTRILVGENRDMFHVTSSARRLKPGLVIWTCFRSTLRWLHLFPIPFLLYYDQNNSEIQYSYDRRHRLSQARRFISEFNVKIYALSTIERWFPPVVWLISQHIQTPPELLYLYKTQIRSKWSMLDISALPLPINHCPKLIVFKSNYPKMRGIIFQCTIPFKQTKLCWPLTMFINIFNGICLEELYSWITAIFSS